MSTATGRPTLWVVPSIAEGPTAVEAAERAAHRMANLPRRALTADTLAARLGLTRPEAEHMIQPYCTCYIDEQGWHHCQHWHDERTRR